MVKSGKSKKSDKAKPEPATAALLLASWVGLATGLLRRGQRCDKQASPSSSI